MAAGKNKMQGSIDILNKARAMELYAIHQYMNQHYGLDDMDYGVLAKKMREISIDEMRHAEWLAERIKDIGGEPTHTIDGNIKKGQGIKDIYGFDSDVEDDTIAKYNNFIKELRALNDHVSSTLMEKILNAEQEHFNYFDDQATHIKELGNNYLGKIAASGDAD